MKIQNILDAYNKVNNRKYLLENLSPDFKGILDFNGTYVLRNTYYGCRYQTTDGINFVKKYREKPFRSKQKVFFKGVVFTVSLYSQTARMMPNHLIDRNLYLFPIFAKSNDTTNYYIPYHLDTIQVCKSYEPILL
jgi:hypothetical protein